MAEGGQHLARSRERRFEAFRTFCRFGKEVADFFYGIVDLLAGFLNSRAFFSEPEKFFEQFAVLETTELRSFADHFIDRALEVGFPAAYISIPHGIVLSAMTEYPFTSLHSALPSSFGRLP